MPRELPLQPKKYDYKIGLVVPEIIASKSPKYHHTSHWHEGVIIDAGFNINT